MDFKRIYDDDYKNYRKDLSQTDKAFMEGYKAAYDDIASFFYNQDVYEEIPECFGTLKKIHEEISKDVIGNIRDWLRMEWYEIIISMIDNTEKGKVKENIDCELPEPLEIDKEVDNVGTGAEVIVEGK